MSASQAALIDDLSERVNKRLSDYFESRDAAVLLEQAAEGEAAALWHAIQAGGLDPDLAEQPDRMFARVRLGWLHYFRHTLIKGEQRREVASDASFCGWREDGAVRAAGFWLVA